ncbi:MAG: DNA cytosine methyltransferase [Coriobacteriaceae bacterium]|uniref:DNA cytosine methyltransferase n=1 Tax=Tractidigestivibacter sp. TaxID=2847320 RepID=UPI002A910A35|nr:DNA cytosine methyltransferase [Tractidigestivibacter sp.]MCI6547663.1 DNA cytosine methyltransferase [Coriobacteriaceae bacterium]MDD7584192.1 DNA cytosine methyltransferase [Coriobacteriaceae bacterium]MDY5270559.1 DNA cytosine methyltransferase [Tractidigestivibacter sp.]
MSLTSIEICAGAGGQALGLEQAGFKHVALVEIEPLACATLKANRPDWNVIESDVHSFSAKKYAGKIDLLAGGVPCPPFSVAGRQLGADDERDLFPEALRLVSECKPRAVMLENVKGIFYPKFKEYREVILGKLQDMGYRTCWRLIHANDYGVSQLRPRALLVAIREPWADAFVWPEPHPSDAISVGELLHDAMAAGGWSGADAWARRADGIAPTIVGGSKKHGGADLGPTRSRKAWEALGVDGKGIVDEAPGSGFEGMPRLTVKMAALVQGFPPEWNFSGRKTAAYRQVGNAFPPPVARAVGTSIKEALNGQPSGDVTRCSRAGLDAR